MQKAIVYNEHVKSINVLKAFLIERGFKVKNYAITKKNGSKPIYKLYQFNDGVYISKY